MSAGALSWFKTSLVAEPGLWVPHLYGVSPSTCWLLVSFLEAYAAGGGDLSGEGALWQVHLWLVVGAAPSCTTIQATTKRSPTRRTWPSTSATLLDIFNGTIKRIVYVTCLALVAMAAPPSTSSTGGIPLQEFRRDIPPGWIPGDPNYPLKLFFEN